MPHGPHFIDRFALAHGPEVELSLVMPAYNEVEGIEKVVTDWAEFLREEIPSHEIIVINDGSTDGTGRILDQLRKQVPSLRVVHQLNGGRSRSVRRGYESSRGTFILQVDSSGRFEPTDLIRLWEMRNQYSLIVGYRTHRLDGLIARSLDGAVKKTARLFLGSTLSDPTTAFRLLRREVVRPYLGQLPLEISSIDLCLGAVIQKLSPELVAEVPVPFRKRKMGMTRKRKRGQFGLAMDGIRDLINLRFSGAIPLENPKGLPLQGLAETPT